jgi:hypothetical protein
MPQPNKRKKQLAAVQDGIVKRQKTSKLREETLNVPKEDSLPIDAMVVPDTITSEAATNTALPDVTTSLPTPIATAIAEAATSTPSPDVVTSLPPADLDVVDDGDASTDSVTETQSNNHPRAIDPSTSTSAQGIKLEPVIKTETAPVPANTSIDQAEAPIPTDPVINGPNLNRTVTVRRKVAKRSDPLYIAPSPQAIPTPLPPSPQAENIPVTQEPRVEEPLPITTDEAARETASPDISEGFPSPPTPPPSTATVNVSTRRRSRRQTQLPPIETSEEQLHADVNCVDESDLSGFTPPPVSTVNAPTRPRSSRRVISTSNTATSILPPCTAAVNVSTRRRSRRQTQLPPIETSEPQQDDDDDYVDEGDLSGPTPPPPDSTVHAPTRRRSSRRVIPTSSTGTPIIRPYTAAVEASTRRKSRRQTELLSIETSKAQLDGDIDDVNAHAGDLSGPSWEARLKDLADYRKIHGHCNVPNRYSENTKLGLWVSRQRNQHKLHLEGKTSSMTLSRIQELESLGFEWGARLFTVPWEDRLKELADYRKIHGHCNVPQRCSENTKLGEWVKHQRKQYRFHLEGKRSQMTLFRVQELERLEFEWRGVKLCSGAWEDRLSELAEYRKIHGHCNVPRDYNENTQLAWWVARQRQQYELNLKEKASAMPAYRIQALESLDFEWRRVRLPPAPGKAI